MPVNTSSLIYAAEIVSRNNDLKVAMSNSLQGALLTGASTFIGGLLGGSKGLMLGGIVGGACAMMNSEGKFRSVVSIISEMSQDEKENLARYLQEALKDIGVTDIANISVLLATKAPVNDCIIGALKYFFKNEKNLNLI